MLFRSDVTGKLPSHGTIEKGIENGLPFREDRLTGRHAFIWDEVKEHLWPAGEVSSTRQSALEAAERDR